MTKRRRQRNKMKDALIAGGICLVVIGGVLYFVPRFLSGNKESGGSLLRIEPVAIQVYDAERRTTEIKRYSIRIGISNSNKSEHVCRFAPRVIETVQQIMRSESRATGSVSLDEVEHAALQALQNAAGRQVVRSVRILLGKQTSDGTRFPKPPPDTKTCLL